MLLFHFPNAKTEPCTGAIVHTPVHSLQLETRIWVLSVLVGAASSLTSVARPGVLPGDPGSLSCFSVCPCGSDWWPPPVMAGGRQVLGDMKVFPGHKANEWIPLILFGSLWAHPSWFNSPKPRGAADTLPAQSLRNGVIHVEKHNLFFSSCYLHHAHYAPLYGVSSSGLDLLLHRSHLLSTSLGFLIFLQLTKVSTSPGCTRIPVGGPPCAQQVSHSKALALLLTLGNGLSYGLTHLVYF